MFLVFVDIFYVVIIIFAVFRCLGLRRALARGRRQRGGGLLLLDLELDLEEEGGRAGVGGMNYHNALEQEGGRTTGGRREAGGVGAGAGGGYADIDWSVV